jgi:ATP-dependent DNA ligase
MAPMKRRTDSSFVLFDVLYADGTQLSNRKVPTSVVESFEGEAAVRAAIEAQDREIALASGRSRAQIKSVVRRKA